MDKSDGAMERDFKRRRKMNEQLRPKTWYVIVLEKSIGDDGLSAEKGLHWSVQPGCDQGCMIMHSTPEAALEWLSNIEKENHWHGDEQDRPCLVLLEMTLSCSCQRTLLSRGIMRLVKEKDDKYTMRWYGLLKDDMYFEDDEWCGSHEMQVLVKQVPVKEKHRDDGGMPVEPPVEVSEVEESGGSPAKWGSEGGRTRKLYGIVKAEFKEEFEAGKGLSWMMQPGGWGSFTVYKTLSTVLEKYNEYEKLSRGSSDDPKQALCLVTITVPYPDAWNWLKHEEVIVPHKNYQLTGKYYVRAPISSFQNYEPSNGAALALCYQATVTELPEDVK